MFNCSCYYAKNLAVKHNSDEYAKDTNGSIHDEDLPEGKSALGYGLEEATKVGLNAPGFINFSNLALKRLLICGLLYFRWLWQSEQ